MIDETCVSVVLDSNVKVADPRSRSATFNNSSREEYRRVRFDGCVVKGATACDWLLAKTGVGTLAIELKGADVDRAAEQVLAGLAFAASELTLPRRLAGLIVCTRYPRIDTKVQRIKQRVAKTYKAPIHVKTRAEGLVFEEMFTF
jgi:hypothetical protein